MEAVVLQLINNQEEDFYHNIIYLNEMFLNNDLDLNVILTYREEHIRIQNFAENWIEEYVDYDFFQLFRMNRETFNKLLNLIAEELQKQFVGGHWPIPANKMLLITLWWLGKGEVLLSVADRFNVCLSTTHRCTEIVVNVLLNLLNIYIVWPDEEELVEIEASFRNKAGFPGTIGAIDGCNIKFKAPADRQADYIDRKQQHSIKLQGIVIADKIFTNIMVGFPGSAHDSRVLRNSGIFLDVEENDNFRKYFPHQNYHIIGDSAYPLRNLLMKPYKRVLQMDVRKQRFNTKLSQTRIVVEHVFGLLKSRFRILNYINVNSVIKAAKIITVCCILHNFCFINHDPWNEYAPMEEDEDDNGFIEDNENEAIQKRNDITHMLRD